MQQTSGESIIIYFDTKIKIEHWLLTCFSVLCDQMMMCATSCNIVDSRLEVGMESAPGGRLEPQ